MQNEYSEVISRFKHDPVEFVYKILNVKKLEPEQIEIMNAIRDNKRIAIKSGRGIGKTSTLAFIILWTLSLFGNCKIPCTAPTQHQLYDILWPEINKWLMQSKIKNCFEWTKTRLYKKGFEETWFAVARSCNVPENMQGFHADILLFIIDETSGVPDEIMNVIEGSLTSEGSKLIMVGNPTKISGTFFNAFHKDRGIYKTLTYSSENSKLVSKDFISKMAKYGKDSDIYRVHVLGQFPKGEPDTLITLDIVEASSQRVISDTWDFVSIGVDPARFGNDESVICHRKGLAIQPILAFQGIDTSRLTGEVIKLVKEIRKWYNIEKVIQIKVDETGIGGGVIDQLNLQKEKDDILPVKELNIEIIPIINNGVPTDEDYKDYGAQMWGEMKTALETISIPKDDELIAQLSTRKYKIEPDGKIKLERKEDMKKPPRRLPSPDRADALALCLAELQSFDFENEKMEGKHRE